MNLWIIESKNCINNEKKISVAAFLCFRNDVLFLGNNFPILRLPKFTSRIQWVNFLGSYLEEYFAGIYFREFNQKCENCENTGNSVALK